MKIFAGITKVDEATRTVFGRVTQEVPDRTGEIFDYALSVPHFKAWSAEVAKATDGKSVGNVRAMHGKISAGVLKEIIFHDDEKAIDVTAKITDDNEWKKTLEGNYSGFSIGGSYGKKFADKDNAKMTRYEAIPAEISIVDMPCVPTATFSVVKSDGTSELRKFHVEKSETPAAEPAPAPVPPTAEPAPADAPPVAPPVEIPPPADAPPAAAAAPDAEKAAVAKLAEMFNAGVAKPSEVLAALVAKNTPPATDKALELRRALSNPEITNGDIEKLAAEYLPEAERTGTVLELLPRLDKLAMPLADYNAKLAAGTAEDLAKILPAALTKDVKPEDLPAVRDKLVAADKAVEKVEEPDEKFADPANKKYPIGSTHQIKAAWSFIVKNAKKYADNEVAAIKARIVTAWKKYVDKDGPEPAEADKSLAAQSMRKGLYNVAMMAQVCDRVWDMQRACAMEAEYEGDDSQLPARLSALASEAGEILCEMAEEETQEEADKVAKDTYIAELRKTYVKPDHDIVMQTMTKAGARHSKEDMTRLQGIHDHSIGMGAECKSADAADKVFTTTLVKAVGMKDGDAKTDIEKRVTELVRKAKAYDDTPAKPKAMLRGVTKGQDVDGDREMSAEMKQLVKDAEAGDPLAIMKLAQLRPTVGAPPPTRRGQY